ncbi:MAG: hypothetical protein AVDCRST_MAG17-607 [uncultured Solirubrobacterales bacterium]|uniref:Uncharacterized protein n=1 Tax=uncultured Solirubrobacterales bacterium TaxID=768556 RepID=A0A6J4S304_9ACTN|nr:MAG: hypothetical protein AVDCRST_MAG17-607 [uncultured Solirubrobacterales bacterium]
MRAPIEGSWRRFTASLLEARETQRALRLVVALVLLAAMAYAVVQLTRSVAHDGRCQDLLLNESPSAYISFEVEGCRAHVRPLARLAAA